MASILVLLKGEEGCAENRLYWLLVYTNCIFWNSSWL